MPHPILSQPLIPVVEIDHAAAAAPLGEALLAGGIGIAEVTLRTAAGLDAIARLRRDLPELAVGAGTVLTAEQADRAVDPGAAFGMAPGLDAAVVETFQRHELPFVPGVLTPTEITAAWNLGCRVLKFFPAVAAGGIPYLRAIAAPFSGCDLQFCATGGISVTNMRDWLGARLVCAVGGTWLAERDLIAARKWAAITAAARLARRALPGAAADG